MSFIILDRDGVINYDSDQYIKSPEEWIPIPGSLDAIAQLNRHGYRVLIVTNQSGIARGYYDLETLDCIHERMMQELASAGGYIDEIFFCPHHPDDACYCRKPKPGLFHRIAEKYPLDLTNTFFVGDSETDMLAAQAAGCVPLLVLTGNGGRTRKNHPELSGIPCFANLTGLVEYVLLQEKKSHEAVLLED